MYRTAVAIIEIPESGNIYRHNDSDAFYGIHSVFQFLLTDSCHLLQEIMHGVIGIAARGIIVVCASELD